MPVYEGIAVAASADPRWNSRCDD